MIWESSFWKSDIIKLAKQLEKRRKQKKWFDTSFANAEKEIMVSAFMIRKLFDSHKIKENIEKKEIDIIYYKSSENKINILKRLSPEKYFKLEEQYEKKISIRKICDQIIHSYIFTLLRNEEKKLQAFWVSSDYIKFNELFEINIDDYIEILFFIGNYWPTSAHYVFNTTKSDYIVKYDKK